MKKKEGQHGIAMIETAAWLVVLLPVLLCAVCLGGLIHDQNVLRSIPETAVRQTEVPGLVWQGGAGSARWFVDAEGVMTALSVMLDSAVKVGSEGVLHATNISGKACAWVYVVDTRSGHVGEELDRFCDARGPVGWAIDLTSYGASVAGQKLGIPSRSTSATYRYIDRIVVIGLTIGADATDVVSPDRKRRLEFGAISVPQQEVVL